MNQTIPPVEDIKDGECMRLADALLGKAQHETEDETIRKLLLYARLNIERAHELRRINIERAKRLKQSSR